MNRQTDADVKNIQLEVSLRVVARADNLATLDILGVVVRYASDTHRHVSTDVVHSKYHDTGVKAQLHLIGLGVGVFCILVLDKLGLARCVTQRDVAKQTYAALAVQTYV